MEIHFSGKCHVMRAKTLRLFEIAQCASAFQSRCPRHRKRGRRHDVSTVELRISNRVLRLGVPKTAEWQRIGNEIKAAMIFTGADFVNV